MNPRLYLELVKDGIEEAYKKLIMDQFVEHAIEHVNHDQNDTLLDVAVEIGPVGVAAEIGSIFTWGRAASVLAGISSSVNVTTAGLVYGWTWSQMPSILYGGFYDSYSFRDRDDPQPLGRIPIRQRTIHESHHSASFSLTLKNESEAQTNNFLKFQFKSFSNLEFTKIYDVQKSNDSSGVRVDYSSYQDVNKLIKNNERVEQKTRQIKSHLQNSERFYNEQKYNEAIRESNKVIQLNPDGAKTYLLRAAAQFILGINKKGFSKEELNNILCDTNQVLELASQDLSLIEPAQLINRKTQTELHYLKSRELYAQGDFHAALETISSVFDLIPGARISGDTFAVRGDCYNELGRYSEALADYEQAAERNSDKYLSFINTERNNLQIKIHLQNSERFYHEQKYNEAIDEANKVIYLKSDCAGAYLYRATAQFSLGQKENVFSKEELNNILRDINKVLELAPQNNSLTTHAQSINQQTQNELHYLEARELLAQGDFQAALDAFNLIFNSIPDVRLPAEAFALRGDCYNKLEKYSEALADYEQAAERYPGKYSSFVNSVRNDLQVKIHLQCGWNLFENQDYSGAIVEANKAIDLDPNVSDSYVLRGNCHERMKSFPEALSDYEQAVGLEPNVWATSLNPARDEIQTKIHLQCGWDLFDNKDYSGAIVKANEVLRLNPNSAVAYILRGACHKGRKELEKAMSDYKQGAKLDPITYESFVNQACARIQEFIQKKADYQRRVAAYNQQVVAAEAEYRRSLRLAVSQDRVAKVQSINCQVAHFRHHQNARQEQISASSQASITHRANNMLAASRRQTQEVKAQSDKMFDRAREATNRNFESLKSQEKSRPGSVGFFSSSGSSTSDGRTSNISSANPSVSCNTQIPHPDGGYCPSGTKPIWTSEDPPGSCGFRSECPGYPRITIQ